MERKLAVENIGDIVSRPALHSAAMKQMRLYVLASRTVFAGTVAEASQCHE